MDTLLTLLRVAGLLFAAAGLVAAVMVLPRARTDRRRLDDATDATVLRANGTFPHGAVLVVNESILANGLGLTAGVGPELSLALAASAVALALGGLVALVRSFYGRSRSRSA